MLKITKIKLKLISDIDKYYFVEKVLREGISYISKGFSEANNKYMKNYYPTKKSKSIIGLDANNLYSYSMSQYFSYGEINWVKNVGNLDVSSISKSGLYGYILEFDLEYPDELHNLYDNYPLAPEKFEITYMLSDYCKKVPGKCNIKVGGV